MSRSNDRASLPPCLYSITNIAPVARVKWRPHRKHHISSCSLMVDHCVNVWDVGRPYIPFATFEGHVDVTTCMYFFEILLFMNFFTKLTYTDREHNLCINDL